MHPTLRHHSVILVWKWWEICRIRTGDVIVFYHHNKVMIKRIKTIDADGIYVIGDNLKKSTDSRTFGKVKRSLVIGKVVYSLK